MKTSKIKNYGALVALAIGMAIIVAIAINLVRAYLWAAYAIGLPI